MRRAQPWKTSRARTLGTYDTSAEAKLWSHLRNRNLGGFKFVRQAPIGHYFVDFLCREKRFIVEVDGATHSDNAELAADQAREAHLASLGYRVFRVANEDVYRSIDGVLDELLAMLSGARD